MRPKKRGEILFSIHSSVLRGDANVVRERRERALENSRGRAAVQAELMSTFVRVSMGGLRQRSAACRDAQYTTPACVPIDSRAYREELLENPEWLSAEAGVAAAEKAVELSRDGLTGLVGTARVALKQVVVVLSLDSTSGQYHRKIAAIF